MGILRKIVIGTGVLFASSIIVAAANQSPQTAKINPSPAVSPVALTENQKAAAETPTPTPIPTATPISTPVATPVHTPAPAAASSCDPNYSGACVPIASDVDCAGGSGNGPAYVKGPVKVIGTDIYKLDSDHDGYGCE